VPTDSNDKLNQPFKSSVAVYDSEIKEKLKAGQNAQSIYQDLCAEENYRGMINDIGNPQLTTIKIPVL